MRGHSSDYNSDIFIPSALLVAFATWKAIISQKICDKKKDKKKEKLVVAIYVSVLMYVLFFNV